MTTPSKPESPQVFLVIRDSICSGGWIDAVCFDRGLALNMRAELEAKNKFFWITYRVEAWRDGDTEGEEIKPD